VRADDSSRKGIGGGVALFVPNFLSYVVVETVSNDFIELICVDIFFSKGDSNKIRIVLCYRSPTPNAQNSTESLTSCVNRMIDVNYTVVFLGDLNFPGIVWGDCPIGAASHERHFVEFVTDNGLQQIVTGSTHKHGNTLDIVLTNDTNVVTVSNIGEAFANSDHYIVEGAFGPFNCEFSAPGGCFLNFQKTDFAKFRQGLSAVDWHHIGRIHNAQQFFKFFTEYFDRLVDRFVPTCSLHRACFSWSDLSRKLHAKQKRLHKKFKQKPSTENKQKWLDAWKLARSQKRKDVYQYENGIATGGDAKKFYTFAKTKLGGRPEIPCIVDDNNKSVTSSQEKAVLFNQYFSSVFTTDINVPINAINATDHLLCNIDFNEDTVARHIKSLAAKRSSGPDGIPQYFLINIADELAVPLSILFGKCLASGIWPDEWKVSKVVPVFKKGSKSSVKNYRPVSLLCVFSKVMESVIKEVLVDFLIDNHLISDSQFGFQAKKSTVTQLLDCLNQWTACIDAGDCLDVVYLDLAKAFDTVSHPKLLSKLRSIGIEDPLYSLLASYLDCRKQYVFIDNSVSECCDVTSGVPQGSLLGPTLFLIFINDLDSVVNFSKIKFFADDAKVFFSFIDPLNCTFLQNDLNDLQLAVDELGLFLATHKCSVMHISSRNPCTDYFLNGTALSSVSCVKDLGVLISNNLKFSAHIDQLCVNALRTVNLIYRVFTCRNVKLLVCAYISFVRSKLEYATEVWNPYLIGDIKRLERVQRVFTRKLPGCIGKSYADRLELVGLQSLEYRRLFRDLVMVYKIRNGLVNLNFQDFFQLSTYQGTRSNSLKLFVKSCNTNVRQKFFSHRVVGPWNSLPADVVCAQSLNGFKTRLSKVDLSRFLVGLL
jgi:hypothetical protein